MGVAPIQGNYLVAISFTPVNHIIAAGWTTIQINNTFNILDVACAYRLAGAAEPTTQTPFTLQSTTTSNVVIWEYSGAAQPDDGHVLAESTAAAPPTGTLTATSGHGGSALVAFSSSNNNSGSGANITGISTLDFNVVSPQGVLAGHLDGVLPGSNSFTGTFGSTSSSHQLDGGLVYIMPAPLATSQTSPSRRPMT